MSARKKTAVEQCAHHVVTKFYKIKPGSKLYKENFKKLMQSHSASLYKHAVSDCNMVPPLRVLQGGRLW